MSRLMVLLIMLAGCAGEEKSSEEGGTDEAPDITGKYQIFPGAATGCTDGIGEDAISENFWVIEWATGLLQISDTDGYLTYSFPLGGEEGYSFDGSVMSNRGFNLYGEVIFEGTTDRGLGEEDVMARLSVDGAGTAAMNESCWKLSGSLTVTVDENDDGLESNDCVLDVPFEASQLSGGSCTGVR